MVSTRVIDLSPRSQPETSLEKTLGAFSDAYIKKRRDAREADAIGNIYRKYQREGGDIANAILEMQSNPDISPSMRVAQASELNKLRNTNISAQKEVLKEAKKISEENTIRQVVNTPEFKEKTSEEQHAILVNRGVSNKAATDIARVSAAGKRENRLSEKDLVKGWDSILKPINKQLESINITPEEKKDLKQQRDEALAARNADIRRFKKGDRNFLPGYAKELEAAETASVLAEQKGPIKQPISQVPEKQKAKTGIAAEVEQQVDQAIAQETALQTEIIQKLNTDYPPEKEKGNDLYLPAQNSPDGIKHHYKSNGKTWVQIQ